MRQRYFLSFRRIIRDRFAVATVAIAMSRYCACHRRGSRNGGFVQVVQWKNELFGNHRLEVRVLEIYSTRHVHCRH